MRRMYELMKVQENPSNRNRDVAEEVLASPSKVPLIFPTQPNLHRFSACMEIARYEVSEKSLQ